MPTEKVRHRLARKRRVRRKVTGTPERPRLAVFRSLKQIYAQVIDDMTGRTLVSASSVDKELKADIQAIREIPPGPKEPAEADDAKDAKKKGKKKPKPAPSRNLLIARRVGEAVAERCKEKRIDKVVFDRGGYKYHGRVKNLAEAARKAGLSF